jgi:hypothetical protein
MNCLVFPELLLSRATRAPRPLVGPRTHVLKLASYNPQPLPLRAELGKDLVKTANFVALPPVPARPLGALLRTTEPREASSKPAAQHNATRPTLENTPELLHQVIAARTLVLELLGSVGTLTCALVERL